MRNRQIVFTAALLLSAPLAVHLSAQWINYPTPGIPRTADGKPNLSAPARKAPDGKPDLSGIWEGGTGVNALAGVEVAFQPWAEAQFKERTENLGRDNPVPRCLPPGPARGLRGQSKIVQVPGLIVMLYEEPAGDYRQIFTDGRELPKDPNPTWLGYSVGRWEGDTLVVDTIGYNDRVWINNLGHPHTEALHVIERYRRRDFGHMEVQMTIDDPKAYTKPWTMKVLKQLNPDTEILEYVCAENERDAAHLVGK